MSQLNREAHPATKHLLDLLVVNPNLPDRLRAISKVTEEAGFFLADQLNDGPELSTGLRKLLEAKDCFVRQALIDTGSVDR